MSVRPRTLSTLVLASIHCALLGCLVAPGESPSARSADAAIAEAVAVACEDPALHECCAVPDRYLGPPCGDPAPSSTQGECEVDREGEKQRLLFACLDHCGAAQGTTCLGQRYEIPWHTF